MCQTPVNVCHLISCERSFQEQQLCLEVAIRGHLGHREWPRFTPAPSESGALSHSPRFLHMDLQFPGTSLAWYAVVCHLYSWLLNADKRDHKAKTLTGGVFTFSPQPTAKSLLSLPCPVLQTEKMRHKELHH